MNTIIMAQPTMHDIDANSRVVLDWGQEVHLQHPVTRETKVII